MPQVPRAKFRKGPRAILNAYTILTSDPLPKLKLGNYGDGLQNHPAYFMTLCMKLEDFQENSYFGQISPYWSSLEPK